LSSRITGLDGLRGLASLIVVLRHTSNAVAMPLATRHALLEGPWAPLLNAQGAVQLFFVLSGYVLAGSLSRSRVPRSTVRFYVRRVFRIHPPYIGAVVLAWAASLLYRDPGLAHGVTPWVDQLNAADLTAWQVLTTFKFPGSALGLVPQGWTLEIEMIFSLLMPLLFWLARRVHWGSLVLLGLALLALAPPAGPLHFAIDFSIGIALFLERERLGRWLAAVPAALAPGLVVAGLACFGGPLLLGWHVVLPDQGILFGGADPRSMLLVGVGACFLVATAVHLPWWVSVLSSRPLVFLGRISFSLYLCHWAVLSVLVGRMPPLQSPRDGWLLLAAVLAASIPLSALGYYGLERPAIRLGRRLAHG